MRKCLVLIVAIQIVAVCLPVCACTVFYASDGVVALGGNNEDWHDPNTKVWFLPAEKGKHGSVYFGYGDLFPQGGMNDQGLFFDGLAVPPQKVLLSAGKPEFRGNLVAKIMEECATVEQALELFKAYNLGFMERSMLLLGDATGDSAIIEGDAIVRKKGAFQVTTNFRQSTAGAPESQCPRYALATRLLRGADRFTTALFRRVLAATHAERDTPTVYSNVYDLKRKIVYLYHFHNFENVVVMDLQEELAKGKRILSLPDLFPPTYAAQEYQSRVREQLAARKRVQVARPLLEECAGVYDAGPGISVRVKAGDGCLIAESASWGASLTLIPVSESRFVSLTPAPDLEAQIVRDATGQVTGVAAVIDGKLAYARRVDSAH